jgi:hypothetical protein
MLDLSTCAWAAAVIWSSYPLTIERLRVLGQLVPLLQGDWAPEEIAGRIDETFEDDDRRWAKGLMELLAAEKFLDEGPLDRKRLSQVTHAPSHDLCRAHVDIAADRDDSHRH